MGCAGATEISDEDEHAIDDRDTDFGGGHEDSAVSGCGDWCLTGVMRWRYQMRLLFLFFLKFAFGSIACMHGRDNEMAFCL